MCSWYEGDYTLPARNQSSRRVRVNHHFYVRADPADKNNEDWVQADPRGGEGIYACHNR